MVDNWRTKLKRVAELRGDQADLTFQRLVLLGQVEADPDFQGWCYDNGKLPFDEVSNAIKDVGYDYLLLKRVLDVFPNRDEWRKTSLDILIAKTMEHDRLERERNRRKPNMGAANRGNGAKSEKKKPGERSVDRTSRRPRGINQTSVAFEEIETLEHRLEEAKKELESVKGERGKLKTNLDIMDTVVEDHKVLIARFERFVRLFGYEQDAIDAFRAKKNVKAIAKMADPSNWFDAICGHAEWMLEKHGKSKISQPARERLLSFVEKVIEKLG